MFDEIVSDLMVTALLNEQGFVREVCRCGVEHGIPYVAYFAWLVQRRLFIAILCEYHDASRP